MWISFKTEVSKEVKLNTNQLALIDFDSDEIYLNFPSGEYEVIEREYNENFDKIVEMLKLL